MHTDSVRCSKNTTAKRQSYMWK